MKKIFYSILLLAFVIPQVILAGNYFKPATLYKGADRIKVTSQQQASLLFSKGYKLFVNKQLGAVVSTGYQAKLTSSISANATSVSVSSVNDINGLPLPCTSVNKCYFNLEPGGARQEPIACTGVSGNSFTGCTRGLIATGLDETGSSTLSKAHNAGSTIILTNISQFFNSYVDTGNNQTINGVKTFTYSPIIPTGVSASTSNAASIGYVNGVAIAGSPDASVSVKGISKLSSAPSSSTNPISLNSEEVSTTSGANKVLRAGSGGTIDAGFYQTNNNTWSGNNYFYGQNSVTNFIYGYQASTSINFGQLVTLSTTTGNAILASASSSVAAGNDYGFLGVAVSTSTATGTVYVQTSGLVTAFSGLTPGADYYVGNTAGSVSSSMGYYPILFGKAVSSTTILLGRRSVTGTQFVIGSGSTYVAQTDGIVTGTSYGAGSAGSCSISINGTTTVSNTYPAAGYHAACTATVKKGYTFISTFSGNSTNLGTFTPIN